MFKKHVLVAFRNFRRNKLFSVINISGLAVGMACCLIIGLYVWQEHQYDAYHAHAHRAARLEFTLQEGENLYREASVPFPTGPALLAEFPEIEKTARVYRLDEPPALQTGDRKFTESRFYLADPSLFDILSIEVLEGNTRDLEDPSSLFVSEAMAEKYFGSSDPIGGIIRFENRHDLKVVGVFRNTPLNSHVHFDFIAPLASQLQRWENKSGQDGREKKWYWTGAWTYVLFRETASLETSRAKLPDFVLRHFPERTRKNVTLNFNPIREIHLYSQLDNEIEPTGDHVLVALFAAVACAILLIACLNFVNLMTAQAAHRARELSVRKIVGASRGNLIAQILSESVMAAVFACFIAVGLHELSAPFFQRLIGFEISQSLWNTERLLVLLAAAIAVGLVSGLYPAWYITRVQPVSVLKKAAFTAGGEGFRRVLVGTQFTMAIILLIAIRVIDRQLELLNARSLGFDREQVLSVKAHPGVDAKWEAFRERLLQSPTLLAATQISNVPGEGAFVYRFVPEGGSIEKPASLPLIQTDYDFAETLGIQLIQGRTFDRNHPADHDEAFLINEKAAHHLGWSDDAMGKSIALFAPGRNEIGKKGKIIGVIKDYHFESLHHEVKPLVVTLASFPEVDPLPFYVIKAAAGMTTEAIAHMEKTWSAFCPERSVEFSFLDQRIQALYGSEQHISIVVRIFSVIAIVISCLGLYGMAVYVAEKRTKEIGIRKTLGASVGQIFTLLASGFLRPIVIANLLAWPAAYALMHAWLNQFAYRVSPHALDFALGAALALAITLLTISIRTWRAASANPVAALKYE